MSAQDMYNCPKEVKESGRKLKFKLLGILGQADWQKGVQELSSAPERLICPLFSALLNREAAIRWHAVSAFGWVVPKLAESSLERARVVMRRFIWNLTDESGGIGWGAPEAMAEIMACHSTLAEEYHSILCSYILNKQGPDNFLEYMPLRQGAFWGVARLAEARPDYARKASTALEEALQKEQDLLILGLAALALGLVNGPEALKKTSFLEKQNSPIELYWNHEFQKTSVAELALAGENIPKWKFDS
jgi:hypothetical protein